MTPTMTPTRTFLLASTLASALAAAGPALAHCDSADGPVAGAALQALETGHVNLALPYAPASPSPARKAASPSLHTAATNQTPSAHDMPRSVSWALIRDSRPVAAEPVQGQCGRPPHPT